ncbi:MAG: hypothetical protein R3C70_05130 [Geminicoccaceae bacterium]
MTGTQQFEKNSPGSWRRCIREVGKAVIADPGGIPVFRPMPGAGVVDGDPVRGLETGAWEQFRGLAIQTTGVIVEDAEDLALENDDADLIASPSAVPSTSARRAAE